MKNDLKIWNYSANTRIIGAFLNSVIKRFRRVNIWKNTLPTLYDPTQ